MKKEITKFKNNFDNITKHYTNLIKIIKENKYVGITNEWIVDNYFVLVERKNFLNEFLSSKVNYKNLLKYGDRLYRIVSQIFYQNDFKIDFRNLIRNINKYQAKFKQPFTFDEISLLSPIMIMVIFDELNQICEKEQKILKQRVAATELVGSFADNDIVNLEVDELFLNEKNISSNYVYIETLCYELNKKGSLSKNIFFKLNELLDRQKTSLKTIINTVHKENIKQQLMVANIFGLIKTISSIERELLIEELSVTEKILNRDSDYLRMNVSTKNLYRSLLKKYCLKNKVNELDGAKQLIERGKKEKKHIGEYLFEKVNHAKRFKIYIWSVAVTTFVLSVGLSLLFGKFFYLAFLFLLIPVSEIVIQIFNRILSKIFKPKILPKMDFTKGIPNDCKTMVVIPTIIKNTAKIDEMFAQLEKYYLSNKDKNLFFALLADCAQNKEQIIDADKEIAEYGIAKTEELNQKYKSQTFFFAYRRRVYTESEGAYLGYERKRGALLHFNSLLLKKFNSEQIKERFFVENLSELNHKIKYVITLDTDSQLVLNLARELVSTMAHPLNKPVIDEKTNKVVSGYGILQPKISVDIESSNKSTYAKLFGMLGGFDVYNPIVSNFYQDLFAEGSFMGKGIYDLEVFQKVLDGRFPESLILSHDLLEGNYIRSGFVSDIEIIDGFPSKFLTDMTRHHRWTRGDTQILPWLKKKVKNAKGEVVDNPINPLGKWKIFDNLRRMFLDFSILLVLLMSLISRVDLAIYGLIVVFVTIALPLFFYLNEQIKFKFKNEKTLKLKPYRNLVLGFKATLYRTYIMFVILPYKANMYLNAFFKAVWRMKVSKKNLLNWLTAEEAEKVTKNDLRTYVRNFKYNYFFVAILFGLTLIFNKEQLIISTILSLLFLSAPFVMYLVSQDSKEIEEDLKANEKKDIAELAYKTWKFFEDHLTSENNYLIPDNYQNNREYKADTKTSATDIGFSIISVISAYKLKFISKKRAFNYLNEIIETVKKLEKWHGHLYNWYNTKTMEVLYPQFVSSVDSGNFVACLIVLKEFYKDQGEVERAVQVEKLIDEADFSKFYTKDDVFSIGYNTLEGELSVYCYNNFASESRLLSYIAIAKGDVPAKHWFCLNKSLTRYKKRKGLSSWAGSLFEYYMPVIFMKNHHNTLLDEACDFAYFCQKEYMEEIDKNMPWGISECAYDELDNGINYKYKVFSVPYLKLQEEINPRIVVSPYSSIFVLQDKPVSVYNNIKKFKNLKMHGKYGLYESYDFGTNSPVYAYFAHHQGMILASIANYLENGLIQNYFSKDIKIQAFEILTKEKIQIRPVIDVKIEKFKKFNYKKETIENDIRYFTYVSTLPEVSILSNSNYTVFMNDRGNGYSKFNNIQLNRYRLVTEQDCGMFLYLKDVKTGKFWSNTFAPVNIKPEKYEVVFASDKIKYVLTQNDIVTTTEVIVAPNHPAEIRKITLKNLSREEREIELTSYLEPTVIENMRDVTHRTFNSLFLTPNEFTPSLGALTFKRTLQNNPNSYYILHSLITKNPLWNENKFETIRSNFLGKKQSLENPSLIIDGEMSCSMATPIDPIMSLRNRVKIPRNSSVVVYLLLAFGSSQDQVLQIANAYNSQTRIDKAFEINSIVNINKTKLLNVTGRQMRIYNIMVNYLYQSSKTSANSQRRMYLENNTLAQNSLWKFGISGDKPIILVKINDISAFSLVKEVLKAFEYLRSKGFYLDVVIINNEASIYDNYIKKEIELELYRMNLFNKFDNHSGNVFVLNGATLTKKEIILFNTVASLTFDTYENKSLSECIEALQANNTLSRQKRLTFQKIFESDYDTQSLEFYNGFGGFTPDGKEYVITSNTTPVPWSNVLTNKTFGSITTNTGCGFTFAYNSQNFKLTSWTGDLSSIDQSEGIKVNGEKFLPATTIYGFGYTIYKAKTKTYDQELTEFVPTNLNAKVFIFKIKNHANVKRTTSLNFWINPVLGDMEEKTSRYLISEFNLENNALEIRNVYSQFYSNKKVFLSSSEAVHGTSFESILTKAIDTQIVLKPGEEKEVVFVLGVGDDSNEIASILKQINTPEKARLELKKTKEYWKEKLSVVKINSNNKNLNFMLNGWLLYQTLSSRLYAKAGYYQVSGAFGFRDQLQDATNLAMIYPEITKNQIIENAKHQFLEGDVLHWWLEQSMFGLRSRYKDDALWLVFATVEYVEKTNDLSILEEQIPFIEGDKLKNFEEEKGVTYFYLEQKASLLEKLKLILQNSLDDLGEHGLPKMGGGDWNDGMNKIGNKGRGESVWLGFFLYDLLGRFSNLLKQYDKKASVEDYENARKNLFENLNKHAFENGYYLRAFFDNGAKVGSLESDECKIDLLSQSFAILSSVANQKQTESVLQAVKENLVDQENKIVKLLTPPFKFSQNYPGYIMDYPQGVRENGGQYTHAVAWYVMALIKSGKIKEAFEIYNMVLPSNRTLTFEDVIKYKTEPYVVAADIYSAEGIAGRGGWTWYTGSSGWLYRVGIEEIFGIKKVGNTLKINPALDGINRFEFEFKYGSSKYLVEVKLGGKKLFGKSEKEIKLVDDGKIHKITVNL